MNRKDVNKRVVLVMAISSVLIMLVISLVLGHLEDWENKKYIKETEQAVRSLQLVSIRDQYSPVATLLADNAYVTNVRTKSGSSRIYYAGLLRDQIREFFETDTLLNNILVYLSDVPVIIDRNYILMGDEPEDVKSYIGYDPFFTAQPEVSLGRNSRVVLPNTQASDYFQLDSDSIYLRFEFPRYIADPANAEIQFNIDYEQFARQTLGAHYNQLVSLYLFSQESENIYPILLNSEVFSARGLSLDDYLSDEWLSLLASEINIDGGQILSNQESEHRVSVTYAGAGLSMISIWDPAPPDSLLKFLYFTIYSGTALCLILLFVFYLRGVTQEKRNRDQQLQSRSELKTLTDSEELSLNERRPSETDEIPVDLSESDTEAPAEDLRSYIDEHFTDPDLNAKLLAETFNYSEKHIYALWREQEQEEASIADYIQELRLNAAYNLIVDGDDPINDIAECVGFSSYNTFYKAFRRKYNNAPSKIRRDGSS